MKAKLIAFVPIEKYVREQALKKNETDHLVNAAWHFAYSALWHHEIFDSKEVSFCKEFIRHFFQLQVNSKKSLLTCYRFMSNRGSRRCKKIHPCCKVKVDYVGEVCIRFHFDTES